MLSVWEAALVSFGHGFFPLFVDFYFWLPFFLLVPEYTVFGPVHGRVRSELG